MDGRGRQEAALVYHPQGRGADFHGWANQLPPYTEQNVEVGFVIVTEDCEGGMVDIHDRRPVVLEPEDAWRWMDPDKLVEEAAPIAQTRSLPTEAFTWWRVDRAVNRVDPNNNTRELIAPINELAQT